MRREFKVSIIDIFFKYLFNRDAPTNAVIKGTTVPLNIGQMRQLMDLLNNGWQIGAVKDIHVKMVNKDGSVITCTLKCGHDFGHLIEIWVNQVYGSDFKDANVVDIGASNGDSSIFFAKRGAKKVIGFEPDNRSYNLALENVRANGVEQTVTINNKAISSSTGQTKLFVYKENPNANSIDKENMVILPDDAISEENVECISLKEAMSMFGGEDIDLLKIDCEGCEYKVLNSLDANDYGRIEHIYLEYHNSLQNLPETLERNGFNFHIIGNTKRLGYIVGRRGSGH
jgi:FkbM family methyltransferase